MIIIVKGVELYTVTNLESRIVFSRSTFRQAIKFIGIVESYKISEKDKIEIIKRSRMVTTINVTYEWTDSLYTADKWLKDLEKVDLFAWDFEAAVKYTEEDLSNFQKELDHLNTLEETDDILFKKYELQNKLKATALDHPSYVALTHFSFATSEDHGKVIILTDKKIRDKVLYFLVNTEVRQVIHNASYDFKHVLHHTGKMPKNYEDSQIASKCIKNDVVNAKAKTGLKDLMGGFYGAWAVTADYFTLSEVYNEELIKYAAIDACSCYKLWEEIQNYNKGHKKLNRNKP